MSRNKMQDDIHSEVQTKRMKTEDNTNSIQARRLLSQILQREIQTEIKLRSSDLDTIEEHIFLTKQSLLKLRQGIVSEYYKEKNRKECLQYPPHPAIQDTFIGKSPRNYIKANDIVPSTIQPVNTGEKHEKRKRARKKSFQTNEETSKITEEIKPCHIQPKPAVIKAVKPPEPRGFISKKQIRIVVGNVSKWLAPEETSRATHKWTVYTKTSDAGSELSDFVSKVVFFLHPSYKPNDVVPVESPPFKLTRRGWGEFPLKARFYFKNLLDNPVDVVHVLKLDNKHTGLETFGAETVLAVWIHLPSENETSKQSSANNVHHINQKKEFDTEVSSIKEEDEKLSLCATLSHSLDDENFGNNCVSETKTEKIEVEVIGSTITFNGENWEQDQIGFVDEPRTAPVGFHVDINSSNNSDLPNFESKSLNNIKNENDHDGLDFLINNHDNAELSQLSSAFIEEVINGVGFLSETSTICTDRITSLNHEDPLLLSREIAKHSVGTDNLLNQIKKEPDQLIQVITEPEPFTQIKTEPEPFIQTKTEPEPFIQIKSEPEPFIQIKAEPLESFSCEGSSIRHTQEFSDDFLDECNVVDSEVVIDCDSLDNNDIAENSISLNASQPLCSQGCDTISQGNHSNNSPAKNDISSFILSAPVEILQPNNNKSLVIDNCPSEKLNENDSLFINETLKKPASFNSGSAQISINNLHNTSKDLMQKSDCKELTKINSTACQSQKVDTNLKIVNNNVLPQSAKIQKSSDSTLKGVINTSRKQLNSIEITDNGKTIAAGIVPVVKVLNSPSNASGLQSIPRKVIVRKLNGEIATILAPISQDAVSMSLKSKSPAQIKTVISNGSKSVNQLIMSNQEKNVLNLTSLTKHTVNISNTGNSSPLGNSKEVPLVASTSNVSLKPICIPVSCNIPDVTSLASTIGVNKPKRRYNNTKEVKSTIIMLQKENGEVILKKEAKFVERKDEINSPNVLRKQSNLNFESSPLSGVKKGNGKEINGAVESNYLLPFIKCSKNNVNPSLIKLQHPMGSKISILRKDSFPESAVGVVGKNTKNSRVRGLPTTETKKTLLPKSSPFKGVTAKQVVSDNQRNVSRDFKASLVLNCPTQNTEIAVNWLIKKFPLVDMRAKIQAFRSEHPYCAKSREQFMKWPYAKQRAAEWIRAKRVVNLLNELESVTEKWTTLQVYDWARIRAFTPMKINSDYEAPPSTSDKVHFYVQPTSEIIEYMNKCKNLKELAEVNVDFSEDPQKSNITEKVYEERNKPDIEITGKEFSIEDNKVPFEPELEGLRKYVNLCVKDVGAVAIAEEVVPGINYPAAERVLISVFHSIAEDIIRRSYNASWIRHEDHAPPAISEEDVRKAILSRKELDFLVPSKVEKKERPPVTVLPNFS